MPYDSQGNFTRVMNWQDDAANAVPIVASRHDDEDDNFAQGFNEVLCRDGRAAMTGALKMGNFKITGLGNATTDNDAVNKSQLDSAQTTLNSAITNLGNSVVKLTSDQTIAGTKTFNESPIVPNLSLGDYTQKSANTKYVMDTAVTIVHPNYGGQIITAANTTSYTAPSRGWVQVQIDTNNGQTGYFYIDGKEVYHQFTAGDRSGVGTFRSGLFFVPQGTTVYATYSQSSANNYICFYPARV